MEWGVDLYAGLEFWTFFQPQSQGVDLYADHLICGNIRYVKAADVKMATSVHMDAFSLKQMMLAL